MQSNRVGLVDERLNGIQEQAQIVASTLAEYATDPDTHTLDAQAGRAAAAPAHRADASCARGSTTRTARSLIDTRYLLARNVVQIAASCRRSTAWSQINASVCGRIYDGVMGVRPFTQLEPYFEAGDNGRVYGEVTTALAGDIATRRARRRAEQARALGRRARSSASRRSTACLLVSTEGGDIDDILREERATLIEVFLVAVGVMVVSSLLLVALHRASRCSAWPTPPTTCAADTPGASTIPSMEERHDEIGDLAASLSAMTRALYDRIDAIERFAADVAHELKNPLTSLKSAVEMLTRAEATTQRASGMMAIVRNDVKRIDRLITDISDASRLDAELSRETSEPVDLAHLLETIVEVYRFTDISQRVPMAAGPRPARQARSCSAATSGSARCSATSSTMPSRSAPTAAPIRITARAEGGTRARHGRGRRPRHSARQSRNHLRALLHRAAAASTASARIPASAFPSRARSSRAPAAASGPRTATGRRRALRRRAAAGAIA